MNDRISPRQFHESDGVTDWRVLLGSAQTRFATGVFSAGLDLVAAIGEIADAANHHPDIDLRYDSVTVRLSSHDVGGMSARDVALARLISDAARDRGLAADPSSLRVLEVAIDALVGADVQPFWRAVLGYDEEIVTENSDDAAPALIDPDGRNPSWWFQQMDAPRPQRNRIHIDVSVPHDRAEERVAAAIEAGGHVVTAEYAPSFWVLADAEGNEACISTWQGRD